MQVIAARGRGLRGMPGTLSSCRRGTSAAQVSCCLLPGADAGAGASASAGAALPRPPARPLFPRGVATTWWCSSAPVEWRVWAGVAPLACGRTWLAPSTSRRRRSRLVYLDTGTKVHHCTSHPLHLSWLTPTASVTLTLLQPSPFQRQIPQPLSPSHFWPHLQTLAP